MAKYKVTGKLTNGKRFKSIFSDNYNYVMGINLWDGTVWEKHLRTHGNQ